MKKLLIITLTGLLWGGIVKINPSQAQRFESNITLKKLWESPNSFTTCESVCYDAKDNLLFISCINGNPADKDGNGFISKLSLAGDIEKLNWITGLNAPKGMGIFQRKLYVTDIDRILEIDIDKGVIIKDHPVKDAKFLNDITIDPGGNVYISDMATGKIHRLFSGVVETWLEDKNLSSPNGLFYEDGEILIGTKNGIFSTDIESKRTWLIVKETGGIDGLEGDGHGNYLISDWMGKIQLVNPNQEPVLLNNTTDQNINAADIEYIPATKTLFVPTFLDNRVMAYELIYK
jgi:hypothetical protein